MIAEILTTFSKASSKEQESMASSYQPKDPAVLSRLKDLTRDMQTADQIRSNTYEEFNNLSLMTVVNRDRRAFNNWIPPQSNDPREKWKANTKRPVTRNKVITIAAHVTSGLLYPQIVAQNDADEEDKDAASVMRDLTSWRHEQSNYAITFTNSVIKALVDPATILFEGYADVKRKVKEIKDDGTWVEKEISDDQYSGFLNTIVPVEELYIGNIYESNIQKQPFLFWRRVITFEEAQAKYGENALFKKYVLPGLKIFYADDKNGFYQMYDDSLQGTLVEEIIGYYRYADLELRLINGVLIDPPDRPLQRQDKFLPFAKIGYEPIGGTDFFYYKSLVDKMSSDQKVIDRLYNMILDGTFLQIMPPSVVMGDETIDSAVIAPGIITTLGENSKFQTINTNNNLSAGLSVLQKTEDSISESSTSSLQAGQSDAGTPATAFEISRQEANAKTILGLFGKMIVNFVEQFGNLSVGTILQHMTVAQSVDILGNTSRLKFRNFLIPSQEGKKTKRIQFSMDTPTEPEAILSRSFKLFEKESSTGTTLVDVNPELFRRNKYLVKVVADFMPSQSESVKKALSLEAYDRMIVNPILDPEAVTSDFLVESYKPGEFDKYKRKTPSPMQAAESSNIPPGNSNFTSQILNKAQAGAIR